MLTNLTREEQTSPLKISTLIKIMIACLSFWLIGAGLAFVVKMNPKNRIKARTMCSVNML